jgi:RNA polymerase sigma factor (sigma-70 family)
LKFNYSLAKKYENLVPLEDGIQIINLKLISIIDNNEWDEDKASLITYLEKAAYWSILAESENFQIVKQTKYMKKRYEESGPLQFTSLDQPVSPDNPTSIGDSLVDDISNQYQVTPEEVWFKVKSLTDDREFTILKGVYADKSDKISTEKIGCELGITNQRCSQIKYNAIKKLKRDTYLKNLHQQI